MPSRAWTAVSPDPYVFTRSTARAAGIGGSGGGRDVEVMVQTRFCGSCGHADTFSVCFPSPKDHRESPLIDPESPMEGSPGWGSLHRNSLKFLVGGNLLSHTLPGAVPSARTGLASGFGKGPGVSLPLSTTDTHTGHTKYPVTRVSCQTLHSGREPHHHWCDQIICFVTNASNTSPTQQGVCVTSVN